MIVFGSVIDNNLSVRTLAMVEVQIQPLDLSCPAKRTPSFSDSRRFSNGSDDVFVTSTERSPTVSPRYGEHSDSDQPQDLSRDQDHQYPGPARKRFLSKFFKDPKGKITNCNCEGKD